jgi:drug/metabolite transporter (DMT)-like permease
MKKQHIAKLSLLTAMVIFGTVGIFRRYLPLPSGAIAFVRGMIGMMVLLLVMVVRRERLSFSVLKKHLLLLLASGVCIGINWVLLFESYRFTTVATATLCYYMAPLFVMLAAPFLLGERLTGKKIGCMLTAAVGMALVSGLTDQSFGGGESPAGILLGLGAAFFYACVILMNQKLKEVPPFPKTAIQLGVAAVTVLPYVMFAEGIDLTVVGSTSPLAWCFLLLMGVLHTGIAYALYFGSMTHLKAQTVALFGYLDPIVAILLSLVILREPMSLSSLVGAVLIIGSTFVSEFIGEKS